MLSLLHHPRFAEVASAALVVVSALIVGRYAAIGMTPDQWACGLIAVLGSVSVAVMVRVWPAEQRLEE